MSFCQAEQFLRIQKKGVRDCGRDPTKPTVNG